MRDYGVITPRFWIGDTGKQLRGDMPAQVLALYLMTSPHSTMTGVFHCPVLYMAHETGLSMEGASEALRRLSEAGFVEYDEASEVVFVVRMASFQIGEGLKPNDNRVAGLRRDVERMPSTRLRERFLAVYGVAFSLIKESPLEAPSKPLRSQEQEQEQELTTPASSDAQASKVASPSKPEDPAGFPEFWKVWPPGDRKQDRKKCADVWRKRRLSEHTAVIVADVEAKRQTRKWREGFEPAPLTYLNGERWRDGSEDDEPATKAWAGAV